MKEEKTPKSKRYRRWKRKKVCKQVGTVLCGLTLTLSLGCGAYIYSWANAESYSLSGDGMHYMKKAMEADLLGEVPPEQVYLLGETLPSDLRTRFSVELFLQGLLPEPIRGEWGDVTSLLSAENQEKALLLGGLYQENGNWRTDSSSYHGGESFMEVGLEIFPLNLWGDFSREELDELWGMLETTGRVEVNGFYNFVLPQILAHVQEELEVLDVISASSAENITVVLGLVEEEKKIYLPSDAQYDMGSLLYDYDGRYRT